MYTISALYTEYLNKRNREWLIKVNIAGTDYGSDVIVDFEIENSLTLNEEFEIGTAILSKLTIRLKTTAVIAPNAKIIPYLALQLPPSLDGANVAWQDNTDAWQDAAYPWGGAVTEWLPLGEFYIDNREQIKDIWVYTCYDKLVYADVPYVSTLTYPTTQQAVWDEICTSLGYIYDSSVVIDPAYMIQAGPAGYSKRQVMGYIASANSSSVYISKDGVVRFRKFSATDTPVFEMTDTDYIRAKQTNPEKIYTKIVVTYNTEDQLTYTAGTGDENHTLYIENPFATQAITNDLLTALNGFSYFPVEMDARGYPQIEAGDRLRFGQAVVSPAWQDANTAWNATVYSWDGYISGGITLALHTVYSFKGGLKMSVEAQSKSDQKSEFVVEGTLSGQINNLNKTAVRENKSYFGMTVTRTEGLTIEREDHKSKLIFNSDVMDWQVDGVSSLHYDAIANKIKFTGTLEAADGVFSGELSAATGTFAGVYTGTLETDQLVAGAALIGGDLIAAGTITASNIAAGTITGNEIAANTITAGKLSVSTLSAISANMGTITAGTIIGATIQTAASGQRIQMDSLEFASIDSGGNRVIAISPDTTTYGLSGIEFRDSNNVERGHIFSNTSLFGMFSQQNMTIRSLTGVMTLAGGIDFGSANSITGFGIEDVTNLQSNLDSLQSQINGKADSGVQTGSAGPFNGGIAVGTRLATTDEAGNVNGFVTWAGITSHSHTQN